MFGIQPLFLLIFVAVPLVLLALFAATKPKWIWMSALICPLLDLVFFGQELLYAESRGMILVLILVQILAVLGLALTLRRVIRLFRPYSC